MKRLTGGRELGLACAFLAFALFTVLVRTQALPALGGVRMSMPLLMNDFKIAVYCPARLLLEGGNPYDRAQFLALCPVNEGLPLYLPSIFALHAPFGALAPDVSTVLYFLVTVALTIGLAAASYRWSTLPVRPAQVALVAGLLLMSRPGQWNILLGQPALEFVLATLGSLYFAVRSPLLAGACLAVTLCKPTFGLPLLILMAARGDLRAVLTGSAIALVANLPLLDILARRAGGFGPLLGGVLAGQREWETKIDTTATGGAVDVGALLGRFLGHPLEPAWRAALGLAVLGAAVYAIRRIGPRPGVREARLILSIICVAILLSVHHHAYDLVLLTPPMVILVADRLPSDLLGRRTRWTLLALFGMLALNYASADAVLSHLRDDRPLWLLLASSNGAALLLIFLLYLGATVRRFAPARESRRLPEPAGA
jgi:hypothetical protein